MIPKARNIDSSYYDQSDYYKKNAAHLLDFKSRFQRYRVRKLREIYDPKLEETVLDLGCGWGTLCWSLAKRVRHITGLDFSETSIRLCNERLKEELHANVSFVQGDARKTGMPSRTYDLIIAADLFEHLYSDDSDKVTREAFRLLKRQGRFSIWTPCRSHIIEILKNRNILFTKDETHVDYKSMQGLLKMLEGAGFVVEKRYYAESHIPFFKQIERIFLKFLPPFRRRIAILAFKP